MSSVLGVVLPETWSSTRLKHVTVSVSRGTAPDYVDSGEVRVVGQAANQPGAIDWKRTRFHSFAGSPVNLKGHLRIHDVLVNSTGTGTLGRVGYFLGAQDDIPCIADSHVTVVRTRTDELDPRYAYYWLGSAPFADYVYAALVVGATNQIELNRDRLRDATVPLPSLEEQRRIADFLDAETSRIDHIARLRREQHARVLERYTSALSEMVTPGLSDAIARSDRWPWLPAALRTVRLGYVARVQSGVTVHGSRQSTDDDAEFPYLRVANVQGERIDLSEIKYIRIPKALARTASLRPGDVVMTEANGNPDNLGRGAVWDGGIGGMVHQNHVFSIRVDRNKLIPDYLSALLASVHGRRYFRFTSTQVGIATTSSSKVLDFPVPTFSIERQQAAVREYHRLRDLRDLVAEKLERQLSLLTERRQALITAAVTGQFDVTTASGRNVTEGV